MIVHKDEFDQLKYPENFKFKVYTSYAKKHYVGSSLIAAESAEEANKIIDQEIANDPKNASDSWGLSKVSESDHFDNFSNEKGLIEHGIHYYG